jgi:23S rRNA pseudouridine1911/1915/1917 synthase
VPPPEALTELFLDDALLVLNKPSGLPIHPTARYHHGTLVSQLKQRFGDSFKADPAHRLDRETSGLLALGCSPASTRALKAAFARGQAVKTYLALALGAPGDDRFTVAAALRLTGASGVRVRMHASADGLPSRTDFEVLGRRRAADGTPVALVACHPRTGRQHQIRAHLHHAGLHLVGDKIYGPDEMIFDRFTKRELSEADHALLRLPRQALHAWRLSLPHPETGVRVDLEAPLAPDLQAFWDGCGPA